VSEILYCGVQHEQYVAAIAETLDCKICVSREKKSVLECLVNESLCQRLTLTKQEARVHVVAMNQINYTVCVACLAPVLLACSPPSTLEFSECWHRLLLF